MTTKSADILAHALEAVILRRLRENRIDGYTLEMSQEMAALAANSHHAMVAALQEALIYFEDREDINYEGTGPNAAMSLATEIRAALSLSKEI